VALAPDTLALDANDRLFHSFKAEVSPANCTQSAVWSTNNEELIEIDPTTGTFTLKKSPTESTTAVLITCAVGEKSATAVVYITKQAPHIVVEPESVKLFDKEPKNTFQLHAYEDESAKKELTGVTWTASDPTVATVDATGKVTAHKAGVCVITASVTEGGKTYTDLCTVTVEKAPYLLLKVGEEIQIPAELLPKNPSSNPAEWFYQDAFLQIDVVQKTVKGLKESNGMTLRVNVMGAEGSEPSQFDVYIIAGAGGDVSTDTSTDTSSGTSTDAAEDTSTDPQLADVTDPQSSGTQTSDLQ